MNTYAAVFLTFLAASVAQTNADDSRSFAENHGKGIVHIADAATNSRSLLAAKDMAPAPSPANASAPAPEVTEDLVRNVTTLATLYGDAVNPFQDITGNTITSGKNPAYGSMCVIFGFDVAASCENEERPVPSCCSSQSNSAVCNSFDNGGHIFCNLPDARYPACCENRNQPRSVCTVTDDDGYCGYDYPVPACCDSSLCSVFKAGTAVRCQGSNVARCCPS